MVLPRLIHPIPTQIQSVLPQNTIQDDGYNEPVQSVSYGDTYTINGQWKWYSEKELRQMRSGTEEGSDGYVLLRIRDLKTLGKTLSRGDRIVGYGSGIGRVELDVYVVKIRYEGHYQDQGGPALVKAFFLDRQPDRQTPGI